MNTPYWDMLYHLDLCYLAYQVYNQTLAWPLDPWHERLSRKGAATPIYRDKRDKFMRHLHRALQNANPPNRPYHGPGVAQNLNNNRVLDPILHRYDRIDVKLPSFNYDGQGYTVIKAPPRLTNEIGYCWMCSYARSPDGDPDGGGPFIDAVSMGRGLGHLFCFEGGTGAVGDRPPAWSCMGVVFARRANDGSYSVHIAFRGSRSGDGARAAIGGLREFGNADWVTDMDYMHTVSDPLLSHTGSVCRGFRNSLRQCLSSIKACLVEINDQNHGEAPTEISVTGHSLGGALATQCAMAIVHGDFGGMLRQLMPDWILEQTQLFSYSAPVVGNDKYVEAVNQHLGLNRIKVRKDPVTKDPFGTKIGKKQVGTGAQVTELESVYRAPSKFENHEPREVRYKLLSLAGTLNHHLDPDLQGLSYWPPLIRTGFSAMLTELRIGEDGLRELLQPTFLDDVLFYFTVYREHMDQAQQQILDPVFAIIPLLRNPPGAIMQLLVTAAARLRTLETRDGPYLIMLMLVAAVVGSQRVSFVNLRANQLGQYLDL